MTDTDPIAEIRARAEAATPGPWRMTTQGGIESADYRGPGEVCDSVASTRNQGDWEFIAHAREDIPLLLAEVSALREVIEKALDFPEDDWRYDGGTLGSRMRKILRSVPAVASPETMEGDHE